MHERKIDESREDKYFCVIRLAGYGDGAGVDFLELRTEGCHLCFS